MKKNTLAQIALMAMAALALNACSRTSGAASPSVSGVPAEMMTAPASAPNSTLRFLEDRVKRDPDDFIANNKLASEYLQRLRETGDITYLNLASRAANASLDTLPAEHNKGGLVALTQVEFSSHDFAAARDHATRLTEIEPNKGYPYQFLGDALLELGQYTEAEVAFRNVEKFGGIQDITRAATEQRLARMALLHGDNSGAARHFTAALKIAASIVDPPKETVAWCQWQMGETAFAGGDYKSAEKYYRDSLSTFPDYFRSLAALGRVRAAQGDVAGAIEQYERVVRILPDPAFVASLGDLYKITGRTADAENQYALVEQIGHLTALSGTLYNRQLALFYADHDIKSDDAYANAMREYETRRDIYASDAVAWTALKVGKIAEAQNAARDALKLGTKDAKLFYHAGMIAKAAGDRTEAIRLLKNALTLNPAFDPIQGENAKRALAELN